MYHGNTLILLNAVSSHLYIAIEPYLDFYYPNTSSCYTNNYEVCNLFEV